MALTWSELRSNPSRMGKASHEGSHPEQKHLFQPSICRHLDCASFAEVWILVTETGRHKWPGRNFTELGWRFLLRQETLRGGKAPPEGESWPDWPLYTGGASQLATCMAWLLVFFNL
eukprot:symbB.v1.2.009687.t1/scaffold620.1/size179776/5